MGWCERNGVGFSLSLFCFSKKVTKKRARDLLPRSPGGFPDLAVCYCGELLLNYILHPMCSSLMKAAVLPPAPLIRGGTREPLGRDANKITGVITGSTFRYSIKTPVTL
jgi:hypothetical protein